MKKHSSTHIMKFLLTVVMVFGMPFVMWSCGKENDTVTSTPTPLPITETPIAQPSSGAPTQEPTISVQPTQEPEETPIPEQDVTPTPTPIVSVEQAKQVVMDAIDTTKYNVHLINDHLFIGEREYYQFGAVSGQEFIYPFLVVDKTEGSLHFFDSVEETIFDFTTFPLETAATPTPTPAVKKDLTAEQAYQVLCTYSKESLHTAKEVSEYNAEYDSELTLINGVNCYRINLSEVSGGKVRNRGEFYISVDGEKCYYIDSDTNEFVLAVK